MATDTSGALDPTAVGTPAIIISPSGGHGLEIFKAEISTYLRELPKLLDEGYAGKHVIVKCDEILSIWDTQNDAIQAARDKFGPDVPIFVKAVDSRDIERFARLKAQMGALCPF